MTKTMTTTTTTTMMMVVVMVGVFTFGGVVTAQTAPVTSPMPTSVMRGVNMFTFSPPTTLGEPATLAELAEMKALGVEYMPVAIFLRQENATSSRVVVAKKETPPDDALRTFLSAAVAMGIKPMVCTRVAANSQRPNCIIHFCSHTGQAHCRTQIRCECLHAFH